MLSIKQFSRPKTQSLPKAKVEQTTDSVLEEDPLDNQGRAMLGLV